MRARRGVVLGVAVVVAFVLLCVVAALTAENKAEQTGPDAARSFLRAWARYRGGTFVATGRYERRGTNGQVLRSGLRIVQRPPNRLEFQFGEVSGRLDRRRILCVKQTKVRCRLGTPTHSYAADTRREVAVIGQYLLGPSPRYAVAHDGSCFTLRRALGPAVAYGETSRFCFDRGTGAPARIEVRNGNVVETSTFTSIGRSVSRSDFDLRSIGA